MFLEEGPTADPYDLAARRPRDAFPAAGSLRYRGTLPKIAGLGDITDRGYGSEPPGGFTPPDLLLRERPTPPTAGAAEKIILGEIFEDLLALSFAGFL